jgi:hypothetical protein
MRTRGFIARALATGLLISAGLPACSDGTPVAVSRADATRDSASNQMSARRPDADDRGGDSDIASTAMSPGVQVSYGAAPASPQAASALPDTSITASEDATAPQPGPVLHFPRDSSGG